MSTAMLLLSQTHRMLREHIDRVAAESKPQITMYPVESSSIAQIGYSGDVVRVKFKSGKTYDYPCTDEQYGMLINAESIGKHFHTHFRSVQGKLVE